MTEENQQEEGGLSRRSMIKRGALVGGAVWAAPAVSTIGDIASAGTIVAACDTCNPAQGFCIGQIFDCLGDPSCVCAPLEDGSCFCWDSAFDRSCTSHIRCTDSSTCPSNTYCVPTCCFDFFGTGEGICVPACGTPPGPGYGPARASDGDNEPSGAPKR